MLARAVARLPTALPQATKCENTIQNLAARLATPTDCLYSVRTHLRPSFDLTRYASSSSSSTRWKSRQSKDSYARFAKLAGLKSRAAWKLLEINEKFRLFRRGDTVVDLGFAPGSWSQVAVNRTSPGGRVVGIDVIPAQPPRGANALQGNFLSEEIREEVRRFVSDPARGRVRARGGLEQGGVTEEELEEEGRGVLELSAAEEQEKEAEEKKDSQGMPQKSLDIAEGRVVNVVLSDMSEPWPLATSTWVKSVSNPYRRMLNTSGIAARDHGGSMVRPIPQRSQANPR